MSPSSLVSRILPASLLPHAGQPAQPATAQEENQRTVAYTRDPDTFDPKRAEYTTQLDGVAQSAAIAANATERRHTDQMRAFAIRNAGTHAGGQAAAVAGVAHLQPTNVDHIGYEGVYLRGMQRLEAELQAEGMALPAHLKTLNHTDLTDLRAREDYLKDLERIDKYTLPNPREIKRRKARERKLIEGRKLHQYARAEMKRITENLMDLYIYSPEQDTLVLTPDISDIDSASAFFRERFNVSLDDAQNHEARERWENCANGQHAAVLQAHITQLLEKVPFASDQKPDSLLALAVALGNERAALAASYEKSRLQKFSICGGSSFVEKGGDNDAYAYKLTQPYGQEQGIPCQYELRFMKPAKGATRYTPRMFRIDSATRAETEIPLRDPDAPGTSEMDILQGYLSKGDLQLLLGKDDLLGRKGFEEVVADIVIDTTLQHKIDEIAFKGIDAEMVREFHDKRIDSVQGSGYSYNATGYGENLTVDCQGVFMARLFKLSREGQVAASGSCGTQQAAWWWRKPSGKITALQYLTEENYLVTPHGNDPYTVGHKRTTHAIFPFTSRAAEYEVPLEFVPYDRHVLRAATPGAPIAQETEYGLTTRARSHVTGLPKQDEDYIGADEKSRDATRRALWAPRDHVPLSLPMLVETEQIDWNTGKVRTDPHTGEALTIQDVRTLPFSMKGQPITASAYLSPAAIVDSDGSSTPLDDGTATPLSRSTIEQLARDGKKIELRHELPDGWALHDDRGRLVRDDETGEPVRLLERVLVEPQVVSRQVQIPETRTADDGHTLLVFHDHAGRDAFLKRNQDGNPVLTENGRYIYEYADGNTVAGPVKQQFTTSTETDIRLQIVGIARWVREPIADPANPKNVLSDGDKVLCTYKKKVVRSDDRDFDPAILNDMMYFENNCVHTQNVLNTPYQDQGEPQIVGYSYRPGDTRHDRDFMLAGSRDRSVLHPVAIEPGKPKEYYIVEDVAQGPDNTHQGHSDMDNSDRDPYTLEQLDAYLPPEQRGQRQGNAINVLNGLQRERTKGLLGELKARSAEARDRRAAEDTMIVQAINLLGSSGRAQWNNYIATRSTEHLQALTDMLDGSGVAVLQKAAERLSVAHESGVVERLEDAVDAEIAGLQKMLRLRGRTIQDAQAAHVAQQRIKKLTEMKALLDTLKRRRGQLPGSGASTSQPSSKVTDIIYALTQLYGENAMNAESEQSGDTEESYAARRQKARMDSAITELRAWSELPEVVWSNANQELTTRLRTLKNPATDDASVDEEPVLAVRDVRSNASSAKVRNAKLAGKAWEWFGMDVDGVDADVDAAWRESLAVPVRASGGTENPWEWLHTDDSDIGTEVGAAWRKSLAMPAHTSGASALLNSDEARAHAARNLRQGHEADIHTLLSASDPGESREDARLRKEAAETDLRTRLDVLAGRLTRIDPNSAEHKRLSDERKRIERALAQWEEATLAENASSTERSEIIADLEDKLAPMNEEIAARIADLGALKDKRHDLFTQLESLRDKGETGAGTTTRMGYADMEKALREVLRLIDKLEPELDRLQAQRAPLQSRLNFWLAVDAERDRRRAVQADISRPPESLVRTGKARPVDEAADAAAVAAEAAAAAEADHTIEFLPHALEALMSQPGGADRNAMLANFSNRIVDAGLLDFCDHGMSPKELKAALPKLLASDDFRKKWEEMRTAGTISANLEGALIHLDAIRQLLDTQPDAQDANASGRERYHYPYPARGRAVPPALLASMGMGAGVNGVFSGVIELLHGLGEHVSTALETAAAGSAIGLDVVPGGITVPAGVAIAKDAYFDARRLNSIRPAYAQALSEYEAIQSELKSLEAELMSGVESVLGKGPQAQRKKLDKIEKTIAGKADALRARLQIIDQQLHRDLINGATGTSLAAAGAGSIAAAAIKMSAVGATVAGPLGIAAGGLLTLVGALQLGLSVKDYLEIRRVTDDLKEHLGSDSGLRRDHNLHVQELKDGHARRAKLWSAFTAGSAMLVAGGATAPVAPPISAGLVCAGGFLIAGSVYYLYVEPRHLRGKAARSADNTPHTRGSFLSTEKRRNRLTHLLNQTAALQGNAAAKMHLVALQESMANPGADGKVTDPLENMYKKLWLFIDAPRKKQVEMAMGNVEGTKEHQYTLMLHTNIQEINFRKFEVEERTLEIASILADMEAEMQRAADLAAEVDRLTNIVNAPGASKDKKAHADAAGQLADAQRLQAAGQQKIVLGRRLLDKLVPELQEAKTRLASVEDLQKRLHDFGPELGRNFRPSTREQFDDLRLRYLVVHDLLVGALGRDGTRELVNTHHDQRAAQDGQTPPPVLVNATFGGRDYPRSGRVPAKAKLEKADFVYGDETLAFLKREVDPNKLFVTAMFNGLIDRCIGERDIVRGLYTADLLRIVDERKAEKKAVKKADKAAGRAARNRSNRAATATAPSPVAAEGGAAA